MVVLRSMRRPVLVLLFVYSFGVIGMALMPGADVDGTKRSMSLFHAFYFFTYSATTTGFGEIPAEFSDEQRLWAILCLFVGVIAWLYAIGSLIALFQNPHFVSAVNGRRFSSVVRRISDPFFLVCGFGDTGSLLARGLSDAYMRAVVLDMDRERIKALALRDYNLRMPGLCADARVPKHLVDAGIRLRGCKAVLILTGEEDTNLKIAVMARFLNREVPILCRSSSVRHQEHLDDLDATTVVDPYRILADLICLAITRPDLHNLNGWFVKARGVELGRPLKVPTGRWILCGYGRLGRALDKRLKAAGIETAVVDSKAEPGTGNEQVVLSDADYEALRESNVANAAGIVAGTDRDSSNLGILMSARRLNPRLFTVVRQNHHVNQPVFDAARAGHIVQASLTTARRILKRLTSPMVQNLINHLERCDPGETRHLVERLRGALGNGEAHLWQVVLNKREAAALWERLGSSQDADLRAIVTDPHRLESALPCVPLAIRRGDDYKMLPAGGERLRRNDVILFCGTEGSERLLSATLNNRYTLEYVLTGIDPPRGYVFSWLDRLSKSRTTVAR